MKILYIPKNWNSVIDKENSKDLEFSLGMKISYNFNFNRL